MKGKAGTPSPVLVNKLQLGHARGDGIAQADASEKEFRASAPYLHDGRAATIDAAIRAHDGEAANPRDRYLRLREMQRRQLMEFLNTI